MIMNYDRNMFTVDDTGFPQSIGHCRNDCNYNRNMFTVDATGFPQSIGHCRNDYELRS